MRWRSLPGCRRARLLFASSVLLAAGCTDEARSVSPAPTVSDTIGSTTSTTTEATTTSSTSTTTIVVTTSTSTTTSSTSTTTSTTSTSTSTTSSTSTSTTAPPPVGQFACVRGDQAPTIWEVRPPSDIPPPALPDGWRIAIAGQSVQGREIQVLVRPVESPRRRVLVIGGIHGNEPGSPPSVRGLVQADIPPDVEVWLVPVANPDGSAAGMRCNAAGVDLNRNFPWGWRRRDGGPEPLSEPETHALVGLIEQVQPDIVVWVHQPLGYVSAIGGTSSAFEQAWGAAAGLPVRPDVTQHGGGESWSALDAGIPSMLVEIGGWAATPDVVAHQQAGFEAMLAAL